TIKRRNMPKVILRFPCYH
ncbi:hypothetical protein VCHENC02_3369B, partial [Vibrio harveyi]